MSNQQCCFPLPGIKYNLHLIFFLFLIKRHWQTPPELSICTARTVPAASRTGPPSPGPGYAQNTGPAPSSLHSASFKCGGKCIGGSTGVGKVSLQVVHMEKDMQVTITIALLSQKSVTSNCKVTLRLPDCLSEHPTVLHWAGLCKVPRGRPDLGDYELCYKNPL